MIVGHGRQRTLRVHHVNKVPSVFGVALFATMRLSVSLCAMARLKSFIRDWCGAVLRLCAARVRELVRVGRIRAPTAAANRPSALYAFIVMCMVILLLYLCTYVMHRIAPAVSKK